MTRPLEGVRVLEMALAVAGPVAGQILGDMGADVIKVEAPFARSKKPSEFIPAKQGDTPDPWNRIPKFNELNRSKRGLALDLSHAEGRDIFLKLVAVSDVVLENFSARVLSNLGLEYETLREHNPGIILVSMPGFGKDGPYANRVSYGPGIDAMSGLADLSGYVDGGPMKPGNHYCDQNAGVLGALSIMAALRHRRRTGQGQKIELAMLEGGIQTVGEALVAASVGVEVPKRQGNRSEWMAPHGVFQCLGDDEWVAIAVQDDEAWERFCGVIGREDLAANGEFSNVAGRLAAGEVLDDAVSEWCRGRSAEEVERLLQAAGVSAGAARKPSQTLADPHLRERGAHPLLQHPRVGPSPVPAVAWQFTEEPSPPVRPAPLFGGDNDAILSELLGLGEAEIEELRKKRTIVDAPSVEG